MKTATKKKTCEKGYPCGKACINRKRKCKKPLEGQAGDFAGWLELQGKKAQAPAKQKLVPKAPTKAKVKKSSIPVDKEGAEKEVSAFDVPNKDKKAYPPDFFNSSGNDDDDFFLDGLDGGSSRKSKIDKGAADLSKGKLLGKGGYGAVFEVEGHAIKVQDADGIREERKASKLQNLLAEEGLAPKVEGVFRAPDDTIQTKMEKLEGFETLDKVLGSSKDRVEEFEKYRGGIEKIVEALDRHKINHGDMHEGNIMINPRTGEAKIIDFGLAGKEGSKKNRNEENRALLDAFKGSDTKFDFDGRVIRNGAQEITFDWLEDEVEY